MNPTQKNAQISAAILALVAEGKSLEQALDTVLGPGTFAKLVGDLHQGLNVANRDCQ